MIFLGKPLEKAQKIFDEKPHHVAFICYSLQDFF